VQRSGDASATDEPLLPCMPNYDHTAPPRLSNQEFKKDSHRCPTFTHNLQLNAQFTPANRHASFIAAAAPSCADQLFFHTTSQTTIIMLTFDLTS